MRIRIEDIDKITDKQYEFIHKIEDEFGIKFHGNTKKEAEVWISKMLPSYKIGILPCPICDSVDSVEGGVYLIPADIHSICCASITCNKCNLRLEDKFREYCYNPIEREKLYYKVRDKWNMLYRRVINGNS